MKTTRLEHWRVGPTGKAIRGYPQVVTDLQKLKIPTDGYDEDLKDFSTDHVFFRNLPDHLIRLIRRYDAVVGCVAWLTHSKILDALMSKDFVQIVVQKEDFLRPDSSGHRGDLRRKYDALPQGWRHAMITSSRGGVSVSGLDVCSDSELQAIRCVGNHNSDKNPAHPRSHHKFVVFCDLPDKELLDDQTVHFQQIVPKLVWTGSFNFTYNGEKSFENAVVLSDEASCWAFFNEWTQVVALSEPLDWASEWSAPEWRIGT